MSDRSRARLAGLFTVMVAAVFAASLGGCTVHYDEISASGHVDYWRPNVQGNIAITKGSVVGTSTTMSLRRDAGLDDDSAPIAGFDLDLGPQRLSFEHVDVNLHGSTIAPQDFLFHGQRFAQGDLVTSTLKCPTSRLSWSYAFYQQGESVWRAGLGARLWTFDMQVEDAAGQNESRRFSQVFPMAVTDASFDVGNGFSTLLRGNLAAEKSRKIVYDAAAGMGYRMNRFRAELGWRFMRFDFNETTNDADFNLSGPFVSLNFRF